MPRMLEHSHCTFPGCDRPHKAHGYCAAHYQQFKRGEEVRDLQARAYDHPETCTVEGCTNPERSKGLCGAHYLRLRRHGDLKLRRGVEK